jgi:stress response protein YsnF
MDRLEFTEGARVIGADGVTIGTVDTVDPASQPPTLLVRLDGSDDIAGIPVEDVDLQRSTASEVRLAIPGADLRRSAAITEEDDAGHMTLPVHAEVLVPHVHEERQGRVLVHKRVETHPVEERIELEHEVVEVEHVPIGEDIDEVPPVRQEGDTTVVPVVEEILVVEKRLRLVEEVRITKRVEVATETIRDELRREVVDIDEERAEDLDRDMR